MEKEVMNFCGIFTKIVNKNYIQELNNLNHHGSQSNFYTGVYIKIIEVQSE